MLRWHAWSAIWRECRGTALKKTATSVQLPLEARLQLSVLRAGIRHLYLNVSCMLPAKRVFKEPSAVREDHHDVVLPRNLHCSCSTCAEKVDALACDVRMVSSRVGMHAAQGEAGGGGTGACACRGREGVAEGCKRRGETAGAAEGGAAGRGARCNPGDAGLPSACNPCWLRAPISPFPLHLSISNVA